LHNGSYWGFIKLLHVLAEEGINLFQFSKCSLVFWACIYKNKTSERKKNQRMRCPTQTVPDNRGSGEMARVYAAEFFLGLLTHKLDDEPSRIQQEPESWRDQNKKHLLFFFFT
jgi:hypothetical protein